MRMFTKFLNMPQTKRTWHLFQNTDAQVLNFIVLWPTTVFHMSFVMATWHDVIFCGGGMMIISNEIRNGSHSPFPHDLSHCAFDLPLIPFKMDFRCCHIATSEHLSPVMCVSFVIYI